MTRITIRINALQLHQGVLCKHLCSLDKIHLGFKDSVVSDIDK